jgi:hypothetical protein
VKRCTLDKIASVTLRVGLDKHAVLGEEIPAESGTVIAARVLNAKTSYNTLEDVHGRMVGLHPGDIIAGVLGKRDALRGYSGYVPDSVAVGDELQILNLGGVIGQGAEAAPGIGEPFRVEVLGSVLEFPYLERRVGVPANVARAALPGEIPDEGSPGPEPPVVALLGTCMDSGKTTAACVLIAELARKGLRVAAGKLTGVSLRRDILEMADSGASNVTIFTDFGVVTTDEHNAPGVARSIIASLDNAEPEPPDVIVLEFGDGLLGTYGVHAILDDPYIQKRIRASVLCALDPVGAWGGVELMRERYGIVPSVIAGRVTDTPAGVKYCGEQLGVATWNALHDGPSVAHSLLSERLALEVSV